MSSGPGEMGAQGVQDARPGSGQDAAAAGCSHAAPRHSGQGVRGGGARGGDEPLGGEEGAPGSPLPPRCPRVGPVRRLPLA